MIVQGNDFTKSSDKYKNKIACQYHGSDYNQNVGKQELIGRLLVDLFHETP